MKFSKLISIAGILVLSSGLSFEALAQQKELTCHGNIETFDKKLIQAGVIYKVVYETSGDVAKVWFAGREFEARAEKGKSWKGVWMKQMDDKVYFSLLPDEGGTIKFQFEENRWFSGNCL
jgi:hypothetical protein